MSNMIATLDRLFPYVCLAYGMVMTITLSSERLNRLADERLSEPLVQQWRAHRGFALVSLWVGTLWVLQNLWLA